MITRTPASIDIRVADARAVAKDLPAADLVLTDPPWKYDLAKHSAAPPYPGLSYEEIADILFRQLRWKRLAMWFTGPHFGPFLWHVARTMPDVPPPRQWGAWDKGSYVWTGGPAALWNSRMEGLVVWQNPGACRNSGTLPDNGVALTELESEEPWRDNAFRMNRGEHSAKPIAWQTQIIRRFTRPHPERPVEGWDLVIDPFLGLGSSAVATMRAGYRNFIGLDVEPARVERARAFVERHSESS